MSGELELVVVLLGFGSGALAGLLGVSGAVLMVPLLLYVPPLLGLGALGVKTVAGIAVVHGLFAASAGVVAYRHTGRIHPRIAVTGGVMAATGAMAGGVLSRWAPDILLLGLFAGLATLAAVAMLFPSHQDSEMETAAGLEFPRPWRLAIFFPEGLLAGMVGVGGGFITVPLLSRAMGVPLRIAISSSLALAWFALAAGFIGKAVTGQVPLWLSLAVVVGAVPGAQFGAMLNRRVPQDSLRYLLSLLLAVIAIRIWIETFTGARVAIG